MLYFVRKQILVLLLDISHLSIDLATLKRGKYQMLFIILDREKRIMAIFTMKMGDQRLRNDFQRDLITPKKI